MLPIKLPSGERQPGQHHHSFTLLPPGSSFWVTRALRRVVQRREIPDHRSLFRDHISCCAFSFSGQPGEVTPMLPHCRSPCISCALRVISCAVRQFVEGLKLCLRLKILQGNRIRPSHHSSAQCSAGEGQVPMPAGQMSSGSALPGGLQHGRLGAEPVQAHCLTGEQAGHRQRRCAGLCCAGRHWHHWWVACPQRGLSAGRPTRTALLMHILP